MTSWVRNTAPSRWLSGLGMALAMALAVLFGLLSATGNVFWVGLTFGLVAAVAMAFLPTWLFGVAFWFCLVAGGLAEFYLGIGQANWLASGLTALMLVAAALHVVGRPAHHGPAGSAGLGWMVVALALVLPVASAMNGIPAIQWVVGLRNYLPFIGVFVVGAYVLSPEHWARVWRWTVVVGLLQLPACLHQALVVAPRRAHSLSAVGGGAEAIVGTFGGNPMGGGYTGEMAVFVLLAALLVVLLPGQSKWWSWARWLMPLTALICVGLAETKVVFLMTPLLILVCFWHELRARPGRFLGVLIGGGLLIAALGVVYWIRYWSTSSGEFLHAFTYSFDPDFMVDAQHRGRIAAIVHWWRVHTVGGDWFHLLIGHGVAASLEASRVMGQGTAVAVHGLGLDAHAMSKMLWDAGLLGFGALCLLMVRGAWIAARLSRSESLSPTWRGAMRWCLGALVAFLLMLPYQVSVLGGAPMQMLLWMTLAFVEAGSRWAQQPRGVEEVKV